MYDVHHRVRRVRKAHSLGFLTTMRLPPAVCIMAPCNGI